MALELGYHHAKGTMTYSNGLKIVNVSNNNKENQLRLSLEGTGRRWMAEN